MVEKKVVENGIPVGAWFVPESPETWRRRRSLDGVKGAISSHRDSSDNARKYHVLSD